MVTVAISNHKALQLLGKSMLKTLLGWIFNGREGRLLLNIVFRDCSCLYLTMLASKICHLLSYGVMSPMI